MVVQGILGQPGDSETLFQKHPHSHSLAYRTQTINNNQKNERKLYKEEWKEKGRKEKINKKVENMKQIIVISSNNRIKISHGMD